MKMSGRMALGLLALTLTSSVAQAGISCAPLANTARILSSANPNDIHPKWTGENYVGLSWSFEVVADIREETARFFRGNLISPRGGVVNGSVYILASEWECQKN